MEEGPEEGERREKNKGGAILAWEETVGKSIEGQEFEKR